LLNAIGNGLVLPFLLVYLTEVRGLQTKTVGLLVGWTGLVALALAPLGGGLIDRYGARRVVLPVTLLNAVAVGSIAFARTPLMAFVSLTLMAIGGAAMWSGQQTILASVTAESERQKTFGLSFTLLNLGIGIGGVIAGALVDVSRPTTFQLIYLADGVTFLAPVVILLTMPHIGHRLAPTGDDAHFARKGGYAEVLRNRSFVWFFVFGLVLTTCGYAQIEVGFTAFSVQVAHVTPRIIGWALAGNTLTIVLAQLFVLRWLDGRSRSRALTYVGLFFAVSWSVLALAGVAGRTHSFAPAAAGVIACSVIFAMGETLLSPVMPALTNALATDELRGRYNAMGSMTWGISGVIGPVTAGPLIGGGHASVWLVFVVVGCLVASLLAWRLHALLTPAEDGRVAVGGLAVAPPSISPEIPSQNAVPVEL
jgi:MFS family permease